MAARKTAGNQRSGLAVYSEHHQPPSDGDQGNRDLWLLQRIEELEQTIDERCALILEVLFEKATELKADFTEAMLRERRRHPPSERGCIGLRVRTAATSAPGMFQIEWYRVLGKRRTRYLRRGKDQHGRPRMQYSLPAFGRMTPWEQSLILEYEPQCARLRAMQHHIGQLRRALGPVSREYWALLALVDASAGCAQTEHG